MSDKEKPKKPKKYNDADTRKPGSPVETPYKHTDPRSKEFKKLKDLANLEGDPVLKYDNGTLSIEKAND